MTKPNNQTPPEAQPTQRTGLRWTVWLLFFAIVAASLAADLGLKYWSFENVAENFQVKVRTAEAGGPEVLVRIRDQDTRDIFIREEGRPEVKVSFPEENDNPWLVAHEIGLTDRPERVPGHDPIVVVPGLLNFQLTLNTGAVFGMGQGARPVFLVVSIVAVFVIVFLLYRSPLNARLYHVGLALILGGALGNLYDRALYSAVRDMLHMLPGTGLWPWIFNIADVALVCGVGLVLVVSWLSEMKQAKANKQSA